MNNSHYSNSQKDSYKTCQITLDIIEELANGEDLDKVESLNFTQLNKKDFKINVSIFISQLI